MSPSMVMCLTCRGELIWNCASKPAIPFSRVAIGTLCQALKFSICSHEGQLVVYGQACPEAFSLSAMTRNSFHVFGGLVGSRPAFLTASLLMYIATVELLNGKDSILPLL